MPKLETWNRFAAGVVLYAAAVGPIGLRLDPETLPTPVSAGLALVPGRAAPVGRDGRARRRAGGGRIPAPRPDRARTVRARLHLRLTTTHAFFEFYVGLPKLSMIWVWPAVWAGYAVGGALARRCYR